MSNLSEQEIIRREKLKKIRELGINPYPADLFNISHNSKSIKSNFIVGQKVTLLQKFCDDIKANTNTKTFYAGNPNLLRLVNTHGRAFYSLNDFDNYFNRSLN